MHTQKDTIYCRNASLEDITKTNTTYLRKQDEDTEQMFSKHLSV